MRASKESNSSFNPSNANILLATTAVFTQELLSAILNNSLSRNLITVTANYNVLITDCRVLCDASSGNITITLPDPSLSKGASYNIGKIDSSSNKITINPNNNELILGNSSFELIDSNEVIHLVTDGTNWYRG